jgi:hypothetical protein
MLPVPLQLGAYLVVSRWEVETTVRSDTGSNGQVYVGALDLVIGNRKAA